jgi:uncharacterized membrane protein HdeD (DUF308 family)
MRGGVIMMLSPPKQIVFYISVLLAVVGVIAFFVPAIEAYSFWVLLVGYVLLALGNAVKGF